MYMQQQPDDMLVIQQILQGQCHAYAILVDKYRSYVFTLVLRYVHDRAIAEELAQDVFVKAWRCLAGYKGTSRFSTWLYTIVHTTCLSHLRRRTNDLLLPGDEHLPALAGHEQQTASLEEKNRKAIVEKTIMALAPGDAEVITLFYMAGQSLEEIGRITGVTPGHAKVKLYRARQKLRVILETKFKNELA